MSIVNNIIDYESGELSAEETLNLFSELVKNGMIWTLQGHYGRVATHFIEAGYLNKDGNILKGIENEE